MMNFIATALLGWLLIDVFRAPSSMQTESPPFPAATGLPRFDALLRVVTQYPNSEYAADARQRMIYLRNRLAEYEIHVADYYVRRGAFVAALDRARYVLETYDGSPSTRRALEIMVQSYKALDLPGLAADSEKVLAANFPASEQRAKKKHWWQLGG
jgi:outer membrane protein assembly factor BamD